MPDLTRITVELSAAISLLQSREASLTQLEKIKLKSLLRNLEIVRKAAPPPKVPHGGRQIVSCAPIGAAEPSLE